MAGQIWSITCFILLLHLETVLGDKQNSSMTDLDRLTLPCYFKENKVKTSPHNGIDLSTTYELFISSPWITHKGCYYTTSHIKKWTHAKIEYNSPGLCSLFCTTGYFIVKFKLCECLKEEDFTMKMTKGVLKHCLKKCPNNSSKSSCGSLDINKYFNVYQHRKEFNQVSVDHNEVDRNCLIAKATEKRSVLYKAVSCAEPHTALCFYGKTGSGIINDRLRTKHDVVSIQDCQLFKIGNHRHTNNLPNNTYVWTSLVRSKILIWKHNNSKNNMSDSECQLDSLHNLTTVQLSLRIAGKSNLLITLQCSLINLPECNVDYDTDMTKTEKDAHSYNTSLFTDSEHTTSTIALLTTGKSTYNTITEFESHSLSTTAESTSTSNFTSTDTSFYSENYVFSLQIGIAISVSCLVIIIATVACCMYRPKRGTYTFPISRSEENIVMATEGPPQHTIPTAALAENYSEPKDKAFSSSEMEGPRFCATTPCESTHCQKTENGEYHHLDFTLRSETAPRFADNNEYAHVRANVISVFEQPWDAASSKVNKLFSQISKSVALKGQNIRNSIIKRRESRSGSPKLKCRASDYCDAWKTQLNKQQFVFDSDVDNQSDICIDVANSTVDSNKDRPKLRRTDSAFPVLPYSERINVKSTHIYDEPDERRMSLRERLLHMISIRPLKMPFGIELDLRASRSKSKIYSVATSLDEIDESVA